MSAGTVAYATLANRVVADAALEELTLPNALVAVGTNHLAVEVHQGTPVSPTSSGPWPWTPSGSRPTLPSWRSF